MTAHRSAPGAFRRVRHRALRVLSSQTAFSEPPEHRALTELGGTVIDGRPVSFGVRTGSGVRGGPGSRTDGPVLWVTEGEASPRVIGHLTGFALGEPDLWVCDDGSWEWVRSGEVAARLKTAASRVWDDCVRTCDG